MIRSAIRSFVVVVLVISNPAFAQDEVKPLQTAETMMEICEGSRNFWGHTATS